MTSTRAASDTSPAPSTADLWRQAFAERESAPLCGGCQRPLDAPGAVVEPGGCWACGRGPVRPLTLADELRRLPFVEAVEVVEASA
jgi:hypothetical protein